MADDKKRPKRKSIPVRIKREVCERQSFTCRRCGVEPIHYLPKRHTNFDHEPALRLRTVGRDGSDYEPPQHSAEHIDALCIDCHKRKTKGGGATTAGTDVGKIKKERKRGKVKAKRPWPKRQTKWPKRRMGT